MIQRNAASFRDPSGYLYEGENEVFRTIRAGYDEEWNYLASRGLLTKATDLGLLAFRELPKEQWPKELLHEDAEIARVLVSPKLPFISWPCEWSFSQLKEAALLTLDLHLLALEHGCVLKDASAYNVQFLDSKPVFIDLLSFERWHEGQAWQAYGQFCSHFLAPLALMAYRDLRLGLLSRQWLDGIPLDLAHKLLPVKNRLNPGLAMHLCLHAFMRQKHGDTSETAVKNTSCTLRIGQLRNIAESLRRLVTSIQLKKQSSEWDSYYTDTNYSPKARDAKLNAIRKLSGTGKLALDLGANLGDFSSLLAPHFDQVLATDYDALTVERHYLAERPANVLPLVLDIAQPTPAFGWQCKERASFKERCHPDLIMALALCHHLVFTFGIPFSGIAAGFAELLREGGRAIVEFVPKEDSQVKRLLSARDDIFTEYDREHFIAAFLQSGLSLSEAIPLPESNREILLFEKTDSKAS